VNDNKIPGDDGFRLKAAEAAVAEVKPGMKLGLGSGRTAEHFLRLLAEKIRGGLAVLFGLPESSVESLPRIRDLRQK